ncbi:hypothetical protein DVH24_016359 [Malus domestica]|uniref:BZIP domain-containing protein n=1 Tax=Malus domestica TaxID=3750 RepID=A0A498HVK6_MALDO|nr:hypothetical protein DVH24_016359 [Malus domestica]
MANSKSSSNIRNFMYSGKHPLLPPKSPFPSVAPSYADYVFSPAIGSKIVQKPREGNAHHQRTSSESLLIEEQPSWLDDLLNEPDTPIRRGGHRRSSSDSFAYVDAINASNLDYSTQDEYKYHNMISAPSWGSQDFDPRKDLRHASLYTELNLVKQKNKAWESSLNSVNNLGGLPSARDNIVLQSSRSLSTPQEADGIASTANEKQDHVDSGLHDPKASSERKDNSNAKPYASETDAKRAKQLLISSWRISFFGVQGQEGQGDVGLPGLGGDMGEGTEVSAELEFLNQQNMILSMENKALKQRLESIAQEQLIKYLEQELLEREIGRLRALYQQQQQQHQQQQQRPSSSHSHSNSRDLDSQFANLSLKHKDANAGRDPVTGALRI